VKGEAMRGVHTALDLTGRVVAITGAAGLLGRQHAEAIAEMGGIPVLGDLDQVGVEVLACQIADRYGVDAIGLAFDVTDKVAIEDARDKMLARFGRIDGLVNNAANNPKVAEQDDLRPWSNLENFPLSAWTADIAVGLTGAFLCAQVFGSVMARQRRGAILNIASDLSVIAPDQRIYCKSEIPDDQQPAKAVSYSVVKTGLIGLTRYLATYWAGRSVRVNALSPGGVYAGQDGAFVNRLANLIPLGRMACEDEYRAAVVFLLSDAASFMTGQNVIIDGGRTVW